MSFSFRIFRVALLFICQGSSFSFLLSFSSLFILPQPLSLVNYFFYLFFVVSRSLLLLVCCLPQQ